MTPDEQFNERRQAIPVMTYPQRDCPSPKKTSRNASAETAFNA
jgi:hypothetical protein